MSVHGFLFTWLLVGVLGTPADEAGFARSMAEFPPLVVLLVGGVLGDRYTARGYLVAMHLAMCAPPLAIAIAFELGALTYWWVVGYGVLAAAIQALSDPARQATLSRVTRLDVQRSITIMTVATSLVGIAGLYLGGRLESLGLTGVLVAQAVTFLAGSVAVRELPSLAPLSRERVEVLAGVKAAWRVPIIRQAIGLNFLSSLFNAGAYVIAIPYIVTVVYHGDAAFYATVMIVFTIGGVGSNLLLLPFMPIARAGRLFVCLQLTRVAILAVIFAAPGVWLFHLAILAWGLNMGVTSTLVRTTVQELAPPVERARILGVLLLSFTMASPLSATVLGVVIDAFDPMAALVPGMVISVLIFVLGAVTGGIWGYRSPTGAPGSWQEPTGRQSVEN